MKWVGIVGTRRIKSAQMEFDVRANVRKIMRDGHGIVSGGAVGVDYIAVDEALKHDKTGERVRVVLPTPLSTYRDYFNQKVKQGIFSLKQVNQVIEQLEKLKTICPENLIELSHDTVYRKTFYARNTEVVNESDEINAYQANNSGGTKNVVSVARQQKKPVTVHNYCAPEFA